MNVMPRSDMAALRQALTCLCWEGYADGDLPKAFFGQSGLSVAGDNHLSDDLASRRIIEERGRWDIVNINTPFVRDVLFPAKAVVMLDRSPLGDRLTDGLASIGGPFARFKPAAFSRDGRLIGLPQRFGPFNLVVNRDRVSVATAREQGFSLALDPALRGRFGILAYEDFNVMHMAIASGLNPFAPMAASAMASFAVTAAEIYRSARLITEDHLLLNKALVDGEIDFYVSGGTYTASAARLAGRTEVCAVTPRRGPIEGRGAIAFVEINAILSDGPSPLSDRERFLDFIASPEGSAIAALAGGACNPVIQLSDPSIRNRLTKDQLIAMQWEDLEEDLSYCADYNMIPSYAEMATTLRKIRNSLNSD